MNLFFVTYLTTDVIKSLARIRMVHSGAEATIAVSQLQGLWLNPGYFLFHVCMDFIWGLQFPPTLQMCVPWNHIMGVFLGCLCPSVPRINSGSIVTLTKIKFLLKMNE